MLFFGTGGFSFRSDASDTSQQTLYGVLDRGSATTIQRADLLQQRTVSSSVDSRETTTLAMPAGGLGWYLDLPGQGERFVGNPAIQNGIVFSRRSNLAPRTVVCLAVPIGCTDSVRYPGQRNSPG